MERKLLFVASSYIHLMNFHLPYLRSLREAGWEVDVGCADPRKEIPWASRTLVLPFEKKMSSPSNFRAAGQIRRLVRKEHYELIIVHTSLAAFFTRLALWGLLRRPRVINMVHGYLFDDETPFPKRQIMLLAERLTARQTDLLLTMNQWDYELAQRKRLGRRIEKIPGVGVDFSAMPPAAPQAAQELRAELSIPADAFVLLCAAEFSVRKSQHVLISALPLLPEKVVLVLAGSGAEEQKLREQALRLGVASRVRFPGYVRGLSAWYAMADAVATASRIEGLPFNVMEAMHAGRPVIASKVKGNADLIRHEENGLLYPYGDAEAFAACVRRLMDSPAERERMAAQAGLDADDYDLERVFPLVWAQYASVAGIPVTVG